jgi:hypothetical protein
VQYLVAVATHPLTFPSPPPLYPRAMSHRLIGHCQTGRVATFLGACDSSEIEMVIVYLLAPRRGSTTDDARCYSSTTISTSAVSDALSTGATTVCDASHLYPVHPCRPLMTLVTG